MKDEIREIINWLNQIIKENKESDVSLNSCVVPFETLYKLQDYITNLQEKYEKYKELGLNQKQFEYENKIKMLEHNCKQAEDSCRQHRLANKNKKLRLKRREEQRDKYKSRCEKAIEYIKSHIQRHDIDGSIADLDEFDILASPKTLLNILDGGDKQ